jgi:hypothetical protein
MLRTGGQDRCAEPVRWEQGEVQGGEAGERGVCTTAIYTYRPRRCASGATRRGSRTARTPRGSAQAETGPAATAIHSIHIALRRMSGPHTEA